MDGLLIHSFIVRIWMEKSTIEMGEWRGSIAEVETNRRIFFRNLADIVTFIRETLEGPPLTPEPSGRISDDAEPAAETGGHA